MLNNRIVVPAALALTQLRRFAAQSTARPPQHLTDFQVLRGVTFLPVDTVRLAYQRQPVSDAIRVSWHKDNHACYRVLANHTNSPPLPSIRLPTCLDCQNDDTMYSKILFHGPRLQFLQKISAPHPHNSSASFVVPAGIDPETAMLDAALQLAIVHLYRCDKHFSLPAAIGNYCLFNLTPPPQGLVSVQVTSRHHAQVLFAAEITHNEQLIARLDAIAMIIKRVR